MLTNGLTDWPFDWPLVWLRDRCTCTNCVHPSGQRLLDPATIAPQVAPASFAVEGDELQVIWAPDGHASTYSLAEVTTALVEGSQSVGPAQSGQVAQVLWGGSGACELPVASHRTITVDERALLDWLRGVDRMGCGLLHDVPTVDGEVARVASLFGHVRVTNYGRFFDVRSVVDPSNLADTPLGLAAHTDNPYRDPVPTMQLLHCLESSAAGGENILVDGWRVAEAVRHVCPGGFALMAARGVTFRYADATADLCATAPIIDLATDGSVRGVRFNARSMQPPSMPAHELTAWYEAYLMFARLLADPIYQIHLRLDPGDLFIVDNRRVLHGRTAFEATTGSRHLQGCYADIDGLRSTIRVLGRTVEE